MAVVENVFGYIPYLRIPREEIIKEHGDGSVLRTPLEKAVASYDEDEITLAYEAGKEIAEKVREEILQEEIRKVAMVFVSSSYRLERDPCSVLSMVFDFPSDIPSFFLSGGISSVVKAIDLADKLVKSGFEKVLVLTGDVRRSRDKNIEFGMSDAGGCLLVSDEQKAKGELFKIKEVIYITEETWDISSTADGEIEAVDERHTSSIQFRELLRKVVERSGENPQNRRLIVSAPTLGMLSGVLRFTKQKDDVMRSFGVLGNSHIPVHLSYITADLKKGENIYVVGLGPGATSVCLEFVGEMGDNHNSHHEKILRVFERRRKITLGKYMEIRDKRGFPEEEGSISLMWRERNQNLRLEGLKCVECGNVFFPKQNYCIVCGGNKFTSVKLPKKGKVFTMTEDYLTQYADIFPPLPILVVELEESGCRLYLQGTDPIPSDSPEKIQPGDNVELTLRIMNTFRGFRNYFWKAKKI